MTTPLRTVSLFAYGTLQNPNVQMACFGRELAGRTDTLPGYVRHEAGTANARVAGLSGESNYVNVMPSSNPQDAVQGTVYEITEEELAAADEYEEAALYRRIWVTLRSGDQAWVYVQV